MSTIAVRGLSALGKLVMVGLLLAAFMAGMTGVVYMSLSGTEQKVPEIVGKDFVESEKQLAAMGLKIKKRADRPSTEKINTILEQLPKPGETVKTGQMILVVVSKAGLEGEDLPESLQKDTEQDDSEKIEEMISEKPKKAKSNSNSNKKKADTKRDTVTEPNSDPEPAGNKSPVSDPDPDKKDPAGNKARKADPAGPKPQNSPAAAKPAATRPSGDQRERQ